MDHPEFEPLPEPEKLDFPYLDRDEAMFLLGRIRDGLECSLCPRWSRGCTANHTRAEMMGIPLKHFVEKQVPGTEGHMCAKLRTIVNLSDAELQILHKSYDAEMKKKVGYLDKVEGRVSYVNASADQQMRELERQLTDKINATRDYYEKQIAVLRLEANRKIEEALRLQGLYGHLADQAEEFEQVQNELKGAREELDRLRAENAQLKTNSPPEGTL